MTDGEKLQRGALFGLAAVALTEIVGNLLPATASLGTWLLLGLGAVLLGCAAAYAFTFAPDMADYGVALGIAAGQLALVIVTPLLLAGAANVSLIDVLPDIVMLLIGVLWMYFRPSLAAVIYVTALMMFGFLIIGYVLFVTGGDIPAARGLVANALIRVVALIFLFRSAIYLRQRPA